MPVTIWKLSLKDKIKSPALTCFFKIKWRYWVIKHAHCMVCTLPPQRAMEVKNWEKKSAREGQGILIL